MLFHAPHIFLDIAYFEAVMIHAGLHARVTRQDRQADDAVADVAATGVLLPVSSSVYRWIMPAHAATYV